MTQTLTDDEMLVLIGTQALDRVLSLLDAAGLDRVLSLLDAADLDRVLSLLDAAGLDRVLPRLDAHDLERVLPLLGADAMARVLLRLGAPVPTLDRPYTQVLAATNDCTAGFDMGQWHCDTTHCAAGWIVTLAGDAGRELESMFTTAAAAALILRKSCPGGWPLPNFFADNDEAAAFIRAMAKREALRQRNLPAYEQR